MMESLKDKILRLLMDTKNIKHSQVRKVLEKQKETSVSMSKLLVKEGLVSQRDLMFILSKELRIPPINLAKYKIDPSIIRLVPEKVARQLSIIPISRIGDVLTVAMSDPLNIIAMDELKLLTSYKIEPVIATEEDINEAVDAAYGVHAIEIQDILEGSTAGGEGLEVVTQEVFDTAEVSRESETAPIVKMANLLVDEAMRRRASDIHIEPLEDSLRIRYRVDGNLHEAFKIPKKNQNALIARFKIMSGLDITETRLPQDGRFKISFEGREIDFRVSALPIALGPKIVIRALDKSNLSVSLESLGFSSSSLRIFKEALKRPYGMILITGPTGSGKSTTLYSIIDKLNAPERNIVTLEEPVEYELEGVTQVEVKAEIGLTFASGLKAILRQSPDVIMVGEIRDQETADIAIKASLTGQLILSTLHTNDSVSAITRLIDMKVEPFLLASSLVMAGAQRLLRKICAECKAETDVPRNVLEDLGLDDRRLKGKKVFYAGRGCDRCGNTGYYGRFGILEAFFIDDRIRDMIIKRSPSEEIKEYARHRGMGTLREEALENFLNGVTTLEEVMRVTADT